MAQLSNTIRFAMIAEAHPSKAIARLNDLLYESTSPVDRFVTVAAVVLDPSEHTATIVCGGHPPPILWQPATRKTANATHKDFGGPPLGMFNGLCFECCQITLRPGEGLVLFTDGVYRSLDAQGKALGLAAVREVVAATTDASLEALVSLPARHIVTASITQIAIRLDTRRRRWHNPAP
jgi:sigma-B regulation protein RsbU (phosphoserine phosphatase)